jgi:hypothetical protein
MKFDRRTFIGTRSVSSENETHFMRIARAVLGAIKEKGIERA